MLASGHRVLLTLSLEPDPGEELCRLLNIDRRQLPDRLELDPGDPLVAAFLRGDGDVIIDVQAKEISERFSTCSGQR